MKTDTLSNSTLTLQVSSYGAELCSILRDGHEYLWQADPVYWKRHSPVLFPIVGSVWQNEYRYNGRLYQLTQHGFARDRDFQCILHTTDELRYRLVDDEQTHILYPFAFELEIGYRLENNRIHVLWHVYNPSEENLYFQIGAHPAFYYPDYEPDTSKRGFLKFDGDKELQYILISEKGCVDTAKSYPLRLTTDGLLPIDIHTFDNDALILQDYQIREVTLLDNCRRSILSLNFDTPVVGLWSPPFRNAPFICIEPWYGRCDCVRFTGDYEKKDWIQYLMPHASFDGGYIIEIF